MKQTNIQSFFLKDEDKKINKRNKKTTILKNNSNNKSDNVNLSEIMYYYIIFISNLENKEDILSISKSKDKAREIHNSLISDSKKKHILLDKNYSGIPIYPSDDINLSKINLIETINKAHLPPKKKRKNKKLNIDYELED